MEKCTPKQSKSCEEKEILSASERGSCEDISVCLPFGASLRSVDGCLKYDSGNVPEDGVYGKIIVSNGCITGVLKDDVPQYTVSPCAPVPANCDCADADIDLSDDPNNVLSNASDGLLGRVFLNAGSGISVSGKGTASSPFVVSAGGSDGITSVVGADKISVTTRNGVATVSHDETLGSTLTVNGLTFDKYGHLTGGSGSDTSGGLIGVIGTDGIVAETNDANVAVVSLDKVGKPGTYHLGGYSVQFDNHGRETDVTRDITLNGGTYQLGDYNVTVNGFGSVTNIVKATPSGGGDDSSTSGVAASKYYIPGLLGGTVYQIKFAFAKKSALRIEIFSDTDANKDSSNIFNFDAEVDDIETQIHHRYGRQITTLRHIFSAGEHTLTILGVPVGSADGQSGYDVEISAITFVTPTVPGE